MATTLATQDVLEVVVVSAPRLTQDVLEVVFHEVHVRVSQDVIEAVFFFSPPLATQDVLEVISLRPLPPRGWKLDLRVEEHPRLKLRVE